MDVTQLIKTAALRYVDMIRRGLLSPESMSRIASTFKPGSFRTIQHLGSGVNSVADRVIGNVGGRTGQMVRKIPLFPLVPENFHRDLFGDPTEFIRHPGKQLEPYFHPLVDASEDIARHVPPEAHAPYFAATPRGVFQEYAHGKPLPWGLSDTDLASQRNDLSNLRAWPPSAGIGPAPPIEPRNFVARIQNWWHRFRGQPSEWTKWK